jgi:tRNA A-37 threonylcarbamoyl transferase component Bud32
MTAEEWAAHPSNARTNPKLSPEDAKRITDEAIAGGEVWDVQEKINARRKAENAAFCGGGLGKLQAPAKFDAAIPNPRCQAGEGAFGTYFVHTSRKYGVKLFRDADVDIGDEFELLGKAHAAGVNAPEPLSINATRDRFGDTQYQTMVLRHMDGYIQAGDIYGGSRPGTIAGAPDIVKVKALREFRKLHIAGLAHGDIHGGNVMVHPRSRRVALVDFGYATEIDSPRNVNSGVDGIDTLGTDLNVLPWFVGLDARDIESRTNSVRENIFEQAENYSRNWEKYELAVNRYHDYLEAELLWDVRRPRSRFVSGADQPRIPGLTARILSANANTFQRQVLEQVNRQQPTLFRQGAANLGLKPAQLWKALAPERKARLAKQRQQPFGTPIVATGTR